LAGNTILAGNRFHKETMRTGNACARALILASGYNSLRGCRFNMFRSVKYEHLYSSRNKVQTNKTNSVRKTSKG